MSAKPKARRHQPIKAPNDKIRPAPNQTDQSVSETPPAGKRVKILQVTLEDFDGDVSAWFEAFHEKANPSSSKLERATQGKPLEYVEDRVWNVVKHAAKHVEPQVGKGPVVLVVSASADQSCVMAKELHKAPGSLAKLFARHMKVQEQAEFLKTMPVVVAVGTPNRLLKLSQDGILDLSNLAHLVVDMFVDVKTFHVLNMPEVARDFFAFFREYVGNLPQDVKITFLSPLKSEESSKAEEVGTISTSTTGAQPKSSIRRGEVPSKGNSHHDNSNLGQKKHNKNEKKWASNKHDEGRIIIK